jgi:IS5 family transposase
VPPRDDLEKAIRESYRIIRQYEAISRTSDRPEERARARRVMAEQRALDERYLADYSTLVRDDDWPDEIAQIARYVASLERTLADVGRISSVASLHQLPPPDFTGREEELRERTQAITQGGAVVSGVRGMGGVGKTVLALKLAQRLTPQYPDA